MNIFATVIIYSTLYIGLFTIAFFFLSFYGRKKQAFVEIGQPLVSVVIPVYNEEKSLKKTVQSVLEFNYPKNKIEIIIVDDGSKDNTSKIGKSLTKIDDRIIYFRKSNGGKGSALNYGIEKAKGDYIATFDADSMAHKDALGLMMPHFSNPKIMAVTSAMKVYNPKTFSQRIQAIEYDLGIFFRKAYANMNSINVTPGPLSIIKKTFFEKYGGYRTDILTEDMEMAMRIQRHNYIIENEPRALVYTIAPRNFFSLLKQRRRWYVGTIYTFLEYKKLFSRKYGELGLFMLPLALISVLTSMGVTLYYFSKAVVDNYKNISNYSSIGFDFFNNFNFKLYYLIINVYNSLADGLFFFVLFFALFTILLLIFLNKKINANESSIRTFINYVIFVSVYSLLYSIWWGVSIIYSITGRKVKWR